MLLGFIAVVLIAAGAVVINDYTPWGGPEFTE
jgi:hypothetical protein